MNFLKIKEKLINKNTFYILLSIFLFFYLSDFVFAEDESIKTINTVIDWVNAILGIISVALGMLTAFVSWFVSPEWWNGNIFGLTKYFREVWILVANVAYIIFAMVLIVIAFMNIIGKGDKWELKQALPRFIVGVLIVPISWFFVQFLLSISALLTVSVVSSPYEIFSTFDSEIWEQVTGEIDTHYVIKLGANTDNEVDLCERSDDRAWGESFISCDPRPIKSILLGEIDGGGDDEGSYNNTSIFGLISVYTYAIMQINNYDTLKEDHLQSIEEIGDLLQKTTFDALFIIIYFVLMVALFLALLIRGIMIWIYIMFSPVFGLLYFFGKAKDGVGDHKFGVSSFIKLVLVPVYVAGVFSFGLVFMFVVSKSLNDTNQVTNNDGNCILSGGVFEVCFEGDIADQASSTIFAGQGLLGQMILEVFGLVLLWIGIMAALKSSEITGNIIKPIEDFGKQVGGLVMRSPMYAPIIPTGKGKPRQSLGSMISAGNAITSEIRNINSRKGTDFARRVGGSFGLFNNEKADKYLNLLNADITGREKSLAVSRKILGVGDSQDLASNITGRQALVRSLKELNKRNGFKTDHKKLIEELGKTNIGTSRIREILSKLDGDAMDAEYSILGGKKHIKKGDVDRYMGKGESGVNGNTSGDNSSSSSNPLEVKLVGVKKEGIQTNRFLGLNIEVNEQKQTFTDVGDYKRIARELNERKLVGDITEERFRKILTRMNIDTEEKQLEIIEGIKKYFKKENGRIIYTSEENKGDGADFFKKEKK